MKSSMIQCCIGERAAPAAAPEIDEELAALVLVRGKLDEKQAALFKRKFPIIMKGHLPLVWRVLSNQGVPASALPDLSQDVFTKFFVDALEDFPESIPARLTSLAAGGAWNQGRKARNSPIRPGGPPSSGSEKPRSSPDLDRAMDLGEIARRLIPALPPDEREALEVVDLRELTQEEAAAELGINRNTLASRLTRGRARLAEMMKRFYPESQR